VRASSRRATAARRSSSLAAGVVCAVHEIVEAVLAGGKEPADPSGCRLPVLFAFGGASGEPAEPLLEVVSAGRVAVVGKAGASLLGARVVVGALDADDSERLGVVAFARDWKPGDVIPQRIAGDLRVVNVLEAEREDRLPVLFVELADTAGYLTG
jgi:hypothetical protein